MPLHHAATTPTATWSLFVARFGVTATAGLIAPIATILTVRANGINAPDGSYELQLLFLFVAMGCMALLSYREAAVAPPPVHTRVGSTRN